MYHGRLGRIELWIGVLLLLLSLSHGAVRRDPRWSGMAPRGFLIIPVRFNKPFIEFLYMICILSSITTLFIVLCIDFLFRLIAPMKWLYEALGVTAEQRS